MYPYSDNDIAAINICILLCHCHAKKSGAASKLINCSHCQFCGTFDVWIDIIYIPENTTHSIINDGEEMIDFLAFGGYTGKQKKKITPTHHIIVH
jgi:hypothetical protein